MSQDIIIVGGGIIGMLTARELHDSGMSITLIDKQEPGKEASWAGGGILSPLFPWRYLDCITDLASYSQEHFSKTCRELLESTGIDSQFLKSGMLMVASDEIEQAKSWAIKHNKNLQIIDSNAFKEIEPLKKDPPQRGLWMPDVAQVRNPELAKALFLDLKKRKIKIFTRYPVKKILYNKDICHGVATKEKNYHAEKVVICTGCWSGDLLEHLPYPPKIYPIKGQMLLFKTTPGLIKTICLEDHKYIIPRKDGYVLFGSTMEDSGFNKDTSKLVFKELHHIAVNQFPILKDFPVVKHWAGLRPASPAGVPYISAHPQIMGLYINSGQFRNGVVLSVGSARLIENIILKKVPEINQSPFDWNAPRG